MVDGDQAHRQPALGGALARAAEQLLAGLKRLVRGPPWREQIRPVVEHQERAVAAAPVELAAQVLDPLGAQGRVLDVGEAVHVPGQAAVGVLLREHDHALAGVDELPEGRQRLVAGEGGDVVEQAGLIEGILDRARRHVGLEEQDHDLARVRVDELGDLAERICHSRGAELADGVAEPELALAARVAETELPGETLGRRQRLRRQRLGDPVAIAALGLEVGAHVAVGALHPPVRVDQEQAHPVSELAADRMALVGDEPVGAVGGREGVVGAGEDGPVEREIAELARAVAAIPGRDAGAVRVVGAVEDDEQHRRDRDHRGPRRQAADQQSALATALGRGRLLVRLQQEQQLAGAEEHQPGAGEQRGDPQGRVGVERQESAEGERADPATGPAGPRPWALEQPPQARRG